MFATAKTLTAPKTAKAKSKAEEIELSGLEDYALIDALIKNLEALKSGIEDKVKSDARELFLIAADKAEKKPANFRGVDGTAEASVELRKRSTRSVLTEEEVAEFELNDIPVEKIVDVSETFVINPAYANDSALLGKIEGAMKKVKGLPEDFIMKQEGSTRWVVSDETVDAVFTRKLARTFLDKICLVALKPKLENPNLKAAIKLAEKFIGK